MYNRENTYLKISKKYTMQSAKKVVQNSHSQAEREVEENSEKMKSILGGAFSPDIDTTLVKTQILDALKWDKKKALNLLDNGDLNLYYYLPESLKNDPDIVLKALQQKADIYIWLSIHIKQNLEVQKVALLSMVQQWSSLIKILSLIESHSRNSKKLRLYFSELLENEKSYFKDETTKSLYELYLQDREVYKLILEKWLVEKNTHGIALWARAKDMFVKIQKGLEWLDLDDIETKLLEALLNFLWLHRSKLTEVSNKFFTELVATIEIAQKVDEQWQDDDDMSTDDTVSDEWEDDEIDLSVGPYSYALIWNTCRVWDTTWNSVVLEQSKFETMNETSLTNFMNFTKLLQNLWLNFLLDKQEKLIQIATDINFYEGEGMSEWKILKFLNSIWKNIWIPEKPYEDSNGNKKVWCFDTLSAAKMKFRELRELRIIWEFNFNGVNIGSKSIFEEYMLQTWLIAQHTFELSHAKWKK